MEKALVACFPNCKNKEKEYEDHDFYGQGTGDKYVGEYKDGVPHVILMPNKHGKCLCEEGEFKRNKKGIVPPIKL